MESNILNTVIETVLPYIIAILELMGIFVVTWSGIKSFLHYVQNSFFKKHYELQFDLANGLATALEFKMAAEILKTVLIREMRELIILGAIIILRALVTLILHFEMKGSKHNDGNEAEKNV